MTSAAAVANTAAVLVTPAAPVQQGLRKRLLEGAAGGAGYSVAEWIHQYEKGLLAMSEVVGSGSGSGSETGKTMSPNGLRQSHLVLTMACDWS